MRKHKRFPHRTALLTAALMLLAPTLSAQSVEWRHREPLAESGVYRSGFVTGKDGRIWSWNDDGVYRSDPSGTRIMHRGRLGYISDSVALADGGVLLAWVRTAPDNSAGTCAFLHLGAGDHAPRQFTQPDCRSIEFNADGSAWVLGADVLQLIGLDGVQRRRVQIGTPEPLEWIVALADGGVAVQSRIAGGNSRRLSRLDAQGGAVWARSGPGSFGFVPLTDSGAFVIEGNGANLAITRVNAAGDPLWTRNDLRAPDYLHTYATADGGLYLAGGAPFFNIYILTTLQYVSSDGATTWAQPICNSGQVSPFDDVTVDSNGGSAIVCTLERPQLLRRDASGAVLADIPLPFPAAGPMAALADGRLRLLGHEANLTRSRLFDVESDGEIHPVAGDDARDSAIERLYASHIDRDGTSYLLTSQQLSKLSPAGQVLWRVATPVFSLHGASVDSAAGQVCVKQYNGVPPGDGGSLRYSYFCLDAGDGSQRWRVDTPPSSGSDESVTLAALDDGNSLALVATPGNYALELRSRDGALLRRTTASGQLHSAHIDGQGRAFVFAGGNFVHYGTDGQRRYQLPAQVEGFPVAMASDAAGNVYALGNRGQERRIWAVDPGGATRWNQATGSPAAVSVTNGRLLLGDGAVYFMRNGQLARFAAASGQREWLHESVNPTQGWLDPGGRAALSPSGDVLVQAYSHGDRLRFERIDARSGARLAERFAACGIACGQPAALALDSRGSARLHFEALDSDGQGVTALALSGIGADAAPTRLDQPGIAGAWWSPYANGEGITFDWLPASRTLFGAWFTYSARGGNDPAELRWYTLQRNDVAPGATRVELPILRSAGGNFGTGPAVAPQPVGSATLTFIDCDNGILEYRFDAGENDARSGTITLSRLTPATQPCVRADGSSVPGAGAQPTANGFDAKFSGTWHDEATSGQGLQLTVQPGGVFFAPWFTYDPQDQQPGNDAFRQHWFTLQGNLAQAVNGSVEALLVQTIGGAFDRVPTYNAYAVGTATLRMLGCDRARLDYRFDPGVLAGPFAARSGSISLTRIGGCAP